MLKGRGYKIPQGSVLRPILFVIYHNDITDNLTRDHLLKSDDFDLIVSRKQAAALQSSLVASAKCPEEWELTLNPSKSEHLPVEDTSNPVTYTLASRTSSKAQPFQTVSTSLPSVFLPVVPHSYATTEITVSCL